jgi:indole-3-glycerol phosphate synthase
VNYLDSIVDVRRRDIAAEKQFVPLETLQEMAVARCDVRDFAAALQRGSPAIIAEIKRASPSAGPICPDCDVAQVAASFECGGAAGLSVLTEPRKFRGSFADLRSGRSAVALPVLCKDFVVDDFQIWKAAAFGADAVLLIVAALGDRNLRCFVQLSEDLGMTPLVEVHDEIEATRALAAGARVIGINNRQLKTFEVDMTTAPRVRASMPEGAIVVAESGYRDCEQLRAAAAAGIAAVLVGESLMRAADRAEAVRSLRGAVACTE